MTGETKGASPRPPMTPERWRAVDAVLQAALACEPARRAAFVAEACGSDVALRQEVESLLSADPGGEWLERPAAEEQRLVAPYAPAAARLAVALEGRYAIERELARGGMATVHVARDLRHGRAVAVKVLREELAAAVGAERFLKEIAVTASLQHPNILPLFDSGSASGLLWYAMPLVEGETLRARLAREGRLPVAEAVRLAGEMADALAHAHRHGVVHRDIKPENVLLRDGHAVIADFGIALALEHAGGERITRTGLTLGTPQYMAPEQAAGDRAIDGRTDVYALGTVLHEMLAGEAPFRAPTAQAVLGRVLHEPPPSLRALRPEVPSGLDAAVRRALAKRPAERWAGAAEFAAALAAPDARQAAPAATAEPAVEGRGRTVRVATAARLVGAALAAGLVLGWAAARYPLGDGWRSGEASPAGPVIDAITGASAAMAGGEGLAVLDRAGRTLRALPANRPWTPRFSPDGRRVAYGAFAGDRGTSDVWVTDLESGTTRQLTDDDGDANDPQWSPDGGTLAYSVNAPGGKDVRVHPLDRPGARGTTLAARPGTQFPSDWLPDGTALLVTEQGRGTRHDVMVQPVDGSAARPYVATPADEQAARISPDGRWIAWTSDVSGRQEVYVDSWPVPGRRIRVSDGGGRHPVWRRDGGELYYWQGGELVAAQVEGAASGFTVRGRQPLFRAKYHDGINTMYDVSPDGSRFVVVLER